MRLPRSEGGRGGPAKATPPTSNVARIRVQLSAAHTPEHVTRAVNAFEKVGRARGVLT
jgi:7-keto-8-aminopelargonate synthetase-like enzyme